MLEWWLALEWPHSDHVSIGLKNELGVGVRLEETLCARDDFYEVFPRGSCTGEPDTIHAVAIVVGQEVAPICTPYLTEFYFRLRRRNLGDIGAIPVDVMDVAIGGDGHMCRAHLAAQTFRPVVVNRPVELDMDLVTCLEIFHCSSAWMLTPRPRSAVLLVYVTVTLARSEFR